jgi:hypothetical protein
MCKKLFFLLTCISTYITTNSQCPDPNTFQLEHFGTSGVGLTPENLHETVRAYGTWAGNYVVLHVIEDHKYKISLLGSQALLEAQFGHPDNGYPPGAPMPNISFKRPEIDHDPMITLYDNTGGTGGFTVSGNILAYNEDASPTETLPELEYVAPYTGPIYIAIDIQPGTIAYNIGTGPPNVVIPSAPADCGQIYQDSTVVSVTRIPNTTLSLETPEDRLDRTTQIYPNPAISGRFTLKNYGNILEHIALYDINGRTVYDMNLDAVITNQSFHLNWNSGVYFLKIKSDKATVTKKLIIK